MLEFGASILSGKSPIDRSFAGIASILPCGNFSFELLFGTNATVEALSAEGTQLNLSHIEPAGMFGGVVEFQLFNDAPSFFWLKKLVKSRKDMRIEIIQHKNHSFCLRIIDIHEFSNKLNPISFCPLLR